MYALKNLLGAGAFTNRSRYRGISQPPTTLVWAYISALVKMALTPLATIARKW
jgi:hypothetical protein